jgi:hypothetical protein
VDQILCPVIEISSLERAHQNKVLRHTFPVDDEKNPTFLVVVGGIIQNFEQRRKFSSFLIAFSQSSLLVVHPFTVLRNFIHSA